MIEELLDRVKGVAGQPADVLRMVEGYISGLSKGAAFRELSLNLEKEVAPERTVQIRAMEAKVEKLWAASGRGDMAGIARGHEALRDQLNTYLKGLEADKDGEKVSLDPMDLVQGCHGINKGDNGQGRPLHEDGSQ
jgi:hypothetical protein